MSGASLNAGVPAAPFLDPVTGDISVPWRLFLLALLNRTGGSIGASTAEAQAAASSAGAAAAVARSAAATAQASANSAGAGVLTETGARTTAISTLATSLAAETTRAKAAETALAASVVSETNRAAAAEALLAPLASPVFSGPFRIALLTNAANDAAAATAGVVVGQLYRNGSIVMQRAA